jgi:hypothetical protein
MSYQDFKHFWGEIGSDRHLAASGDKGTLGALRSRIEPLLPPRRRGEERGRFTARRARVWAVIERCPSDAWIEDALSYWLRFLTGDLEKFEAVWTDLIEERVAVADGDVGRKELLKARFGAFLPQTHADAALGLH